VDHRTIRERVGVGYAQLEQVGTRLHARLAYAARLLERRKARHQVRHQRRSLAGARKCFGDPL
jgi:hypothetical protein